MRIFLSLAGIHVPRFLKRRKLETLFAATADAFGTDMPPIDGVNFEDYLVRYARFTKEKAEDAIRKGMENQVKYRLYQNAYRLGQRLREEFGVKSMKDAMRLARLVYGIVEIDFKGSAQAEVVINKCFFSSYYSPAVCGIISSLDAGLLQGISGGGRLSFQQRLTEGGECCRARLSFGVRST